MKCKWSHRPLGYVMCVLALCCVVAQRGQGQLSSADLMDSAARITSHWNGNNRLGAADWLAGQGRVVIGEYATGEYCLFCAFNVEQIELLSQKYPSDVFIPLAYQFDGQFPLNDPADSTLYHLYHWYGYKNEGITGIFPDAPKEPQESHTWFFWIGGFLGKDAMSDGGEFVEHSPLEQPRMMHALDARIDADLKNPRRHFFNFMVYYKGGRS